MTSGSSPRLIKYIPPTHIYLSLQSTQFGIANTSLLRLRNWHGFSLLVMSVTDKVACFAAQFIWIFDSYSVLCVRDSEIGTFTDYALLSSKPAGSPDFAKVLLLPK